MPLTTGKWAGVNGLSVANGALKVGEGAGATTLADPKQFVGCRGDAATPEAVLLVKNGLSAAQALQAGTVVDARLLQMEDRIGKLAPGYFADVIAVPGDVLQNPSAVENVLLVVKGGRVVNRGK